MMQSRSSSPLASPHAVTTLVVTLTLLAGLTACGESGGEPAVSPSATATTSASPTTTPTPSPTPTATYKPASAEGPAENVPVPVLPAEAKKETKAGLEAFAKYWYELVEYAYETGDLEPLKAVSGPSCVACNGAYELVTKGYVADDYTSGGAFKVIATDSKFTITPEGNYQIIVQSSREPLTYYDAPNEPIVVKNEVKSAVQIMEASFSDAGWTANTVETMR